MFTKEDKLPTLEELEVPEIQLGSAYLRAGACHLGKYCEPENNEFVLCKLETNNPVKCLNEGKAVTSCSMKFFVTRSDNRGKSFKIESPQHRKKM